MIANVMWPSLAYITRIELVHAKGSKSIYNYSPYKLVDVVYYVFKVSMHISSGSTNTFKKQIITCTVICPNIASCIAGTFRGYK